MAFPDRIKRTVDVAHPPHTVWTALTTAEGPGAWFGDEATIDLRPGGPDAVGENGPTAQMRRTGWKSRWCSGSPGPFTGCRRRAWG
jgi:uncharacterized protein YndB with AHSA1/START domain